MNDDDADVDENEFGVNINSKTLRMDDNSVVDSRRRVDSDDGDI